MNVSCFSKKYEVRKLNSDDLNDILALCMPNTFFYQCCPPFPSRQSILEDMAVTPPGKEFADKYYIGYFREEKLVAVMDFIHSYPDDETDFIGFFMTDVSFQNKGTGSEIIDELCDYLKSEGRKHIRLGWVKKNYKAENFWHKMGFKETGKTYSTDNYEVIVAQKSL